jgi:hypothetical protein
MTMQINDQQVRNVSVIGPSGGAIITNTPTTGYLLTATDSSHAAWTSPATLSGTLNNAYNSGGAGAGRTITANSGAVQILKSSLDANNALEIAVSGGTGLAAVFSGATISCPTSFTASERFGVGADASSNGAAFGNSAVAGVRAVAFGNTAGAGNDGVAVGYDADTNNPSCVAVGRSAKANGTFTVAMGYNAVADGDTGVVIGKDSSIGANSTSGTVLGQGSSVAANMVGVTIVGQGVTISSNTCTAIGQGITIGTSSNQDVVIGQGASIGNNISAAVVIGNSSTATGDRAVVNGSQAAAGSDGTALGYNASASPSAVAIGRGSSTTGSNQFVAGSISAVITDIYFGAGVSSRTSQTDSYALHGCNSVTNGFAGGGITLQGGNGFGTGVGGAMAIIGGTGSSNGPSAGGSVTILGGQGNTFGGTGSAGGIATIRSGASVGSNVAGAIAQIMGGQSTGNQLGGEIRFFTTNAGSSGSSTNSYVQAMGIDGYGNIVLTDPGAGAMSTSATGGFTYLPTMSGAPIGTPSFSSAGSTATIFDSTNKVVWARSGGAWSSVSGTLTRSGTTFSGVAISPVNGSSYTTIATHSFTPSRTGTVLICFRGLASGNSNSGSVYLEGAAGSPSITGGATLNFDGLGQSWFSITLPVDVTAGSPVSANLFAAAAVATGSPLLTGSISAVACTPI